jgi:hypothetical protein
MSAEYPSEGGECKAWGIYRTNHKPLHLRYATGPSSPFSRIHLIIAINPHIASPLPIYPLEMAAEKESDPAATCPVDHKAREAWLKQAKAQNSSQPTPTTPHAPLEVSSGCDSSQLDQAPTPSATSPPAPSTSSILGSIRLGTQREVSTIPRSVPTAEPLPSARDARPANNEGETGADKKTGNWIYPSEQMFFDAMKRKAYNPEQADMKTIVPIHNAVNERAWKEIKEWEKGRGSEKYVTYRHPDSSQHQHFVYPYEKTYEKSILTWHSIVAAAPV